MNRPTLVAGTILALSLAAGCAWQEGAVWSPDGRRIAWVRPGGALWLAELGGDADAVEVAPRGHSPAFLTSRRLVFLPPDGRGVQVFDVGGKAAGLVPPPEGGRYVWLAAAPDGESLFLLAAEGAAPAGRLWRFWIKAAEGLPRWEALTPEDVAAWNPALSPDGRDLVYSTVVEGNGKATEAVLWYLMVRAKRTRRLAAVRAAEGKVEIGLRAVWLPDGKRVAYGAASARSFHILELAGGEVRDVRLPFGPERSVIHAAFDPKGERAYLTTVALEGKAGWGLGELLLADGTWKPLAESADAPVGLRSFGPDGRHAELGPAGLRVTGAAGAAGGARVYPVSAGEFEARARELLAAKDTAGALRALAKATARAGSAFDRARLEYLAGEAHAVGGEARAAATALLRGFLDYPVQDVPLAEVRSRLAKLAAEQPENDALALAAEAADAEAAGRSATAARLYAELAGAAADPGCAAGALFRRARALLAMGQVSEAARGFLKAGGAEDFSQRDYALALVAACHLAAGRADLAREDLMRAKDCCPESLLAADCARLADGIGKTAPVAPPPATAASAGWKATALARVARRVVIGLAPAPLFEGGAARVALDRYTASRVLVEPPRGETREVLPAAPVVVTRLAFSPDGERVAFLAAPGMDREATHLVCLDLEGRVLNGRKADLADGSLESFPAAAGYAWGPDGMPRAK